MEDVMLFIKIISQVSDDWKPVVSRSPGSDSDWALCSDELEKKILTGKLSASDFVVLQLEKVIEFSIKACLAEEVK